VGVRIKRRREVSDGSRLTMAFSGGREASFAWFIGVLGAAPLMRIVGRLAFLCTHIIMKKNALPCV
jgi:hypothetical protein